MNDYGRDTEGVYDLEYGIQWNGTERHGIKVIVCKFCLNEGQRTIHVNTIATKFFLRKWRELYTSDIFDIQKRDTGDWKNKNDGWPRWFDEKIEFGQSRCKMRYSIVQAMCVVMWRFNRIRTTSRFMDVLELYDRMALP